jgi:hypothetical protein
MRLRLVAAARAAGHLRSKIDERRGLAEEAAVRLKAAAVTPFLLKPFNRIPRIYIGVEGAGLPVAVGAGAGSSGHPAERADAELRATGVKGAALEGHPATAPAALVPMHGLYAAGI